MRKYENLFQIGEVADLYAISRKMILNYEKNKLIAPTAVDKYSGYRYYDCNTVARIGIVLDLRRAGLSIPEIKGYFMGKLSINEQIESLKEQERRIQAAIEQLKIRNIAKGQISDVKETTLAAQACICKDIVAANTAFAVNEVARLYEDCIKRGYCFSNGDFSFCEFKADLLSDNFFETENINMRICIGVNNAPKGNDLAFFPETKAVSISFCGEYNQSIIAYASLKAYIIERRLKITGYPREYYLEGSFSDAGSNNIVRIVVPIE